jgi:hypothetical protein
VKEECEEVCFDETRAQQDRVKARNVRAVAAQALNLFQKLWTVRIVEEGKGAFSASSSRPKARPRLTEAFSLPFFHKARRPREPLRRLSLSEPASEKAAVPIFLQRVRPSIVVHQKDYWFLTNQP